MSVKSSERFLVIIFLTNTDIDETKISSESLVQLIQTGAIDKQSFEFLLNNFAGLTNITLNK